MLMVQVRVKVLTGLNFSFYNGGSRERQLLWETYSKIVAHVNTIFKVGFQPSPSPFNELNRVSYRRD